MVRRAPGPQSPPPAAGNGSAGVVGASSHKTRHKGAGQASQRSPWRHAGMCHNETQWTPKSPKWRRTKPANCSIFVSLKVAKTQLIYNRNMQSTNTHISHRNRGDIAALWHSSYFQALAQKGTKQSRLLLRSYPIFSFAFVVKVRETIRKIGGKVNKAILPISHAAEFSRGRLRHASASLGMATWRWRPKLFKRRHGWA